MSGPAIATSKGKVPRRRRLSRALLVLGVATGTVLAGFLAIWLGVSFVLSSQAGRRLAVMQVVNAQLGFDLGAPYSPYAERLQVQAVVEGSPAAVAGLRTNDVIRWRSTDTLYKRILDGQGGTVRIPVCRDGAEREVAIAVPSLELPDGSDGLLWADWLDRQPLGCRQETNPSR